MNKKEKIHNEKTSTNIEKENQKIENNKFTEEIHDVNPQIEKQITKYTNETILKLKEEINILKKKERDIILRSKAEIENIRKRNEKDIEKAYKFSLENFINDLLPVIDNLERAISIFDKNTKQYPSILEGLELTLKTFLNILNKNGINSIEKNNVPFDPSLHQAVTVKKSDKHEPNQVIDVMQKGYTIHGRLLRPAIVIVSQ
ncbi:MAG: nucleotide exchange factor GrpE [Arsenophonus sp.]|nr:MAG: nucleotide exchange factor GrpE [Arsenophonus sp.]